MGEPGFCQHQLTCASRLGTLTNLFLPLLQAPGTRVFFGLYVQGQADPFGAAVELCVSSFTENSVKIEAQIPVIR